ncbi:hypothetical protein [Vibrio crassostreae]|uniref:hypothetical protein n=1 Tax=Vibrio crassostreae TaxID=246167 RepID=UPI001B30AC04|nr:hypothetical protein [Vibrio crassostreae]
MNKITLTIATCLALAGCASQTSPHYNYYKVKIERPSGSSDIKTFRLFHDGNIAAHDYSKDFSVQVIHKPENLFARFSLPDMNQECEIKESVPLLTEEEDLFCQTDDGHRMNVKVRTYRNKKRTNPLHYDGKSLIMLLNK